MSYFAKKLRPGFITSKLGLGEERQGLRCKYNTTYSNTDGLGSDWQKGTVKKILRMPPNTRNTPFVAVLMEIYPIHLCFSWHLSIHMIWIK